LHYQTEAEALVVVIDSDFTPIHDPVHEQPSQANAECRLCIMRQIVARTRGILRPIPGRSSLQVGLGLTVPAVEAWYRCGRDRAVSEAAWLVGLKGGPFPYTKPQLKQAVYGTDRPSLEWETQCAIREAKRLAQDLRTLENFFPNGFGTLAREIRTW
jgi:hypothetical protein